MSLQLKVIWLKTAAVMKIITDLCAAISVRILDNDEFINTAKRLSLRRAIAACLSANNHIRDGLSSLCGHIKQHVRLIRR